MTQTRCTQCGANLELEADLLFTHCSHCGATFYLDYSQQGQHLYARPQISPRNIQKALRTKILPENSPHKLNISLAQVFYVPFWEINGTLIPAYKTHVSEFYGLATPGLDYKFFDRKQLESATVIDAVLSAEDALDDYRKKDQTPLTITKKSKLYHLPFYHVEFDVDGKIGSAWIEAGQGKIIQLSRPSMAAAYTPTQEFRWVIPFFFLFYLAGLIFPSYFKILVYITTILILYWYWLPKMDK